MRQIQLVRMTATLDTLDLHTVLTTSWQVCGAAQLPVPSARYSMGAERTEVSVGDGAFHLHVAQVNAILHL